MADDEIDVLESVDDNLPTSSYYRVAEPIVIRGVGRLTMYANLVALPCFMSHKFAALASAHALRPTFRARSPADSRPRSCATRCSGSTTCSRRRCARTSFG